MDRSVSEGPSRYTSVHCALCISSHNECDCVCKTRGNEAKGRDMIGADAVLIIISTIMKQNSQSCFKHEFLEVSLFATFKRCRAGHLHVLFVGFWMFRSNPWDAKHNESSEIECDSKNHYINIHSNSWSNHSAERNQTAQTRETYIHSNDT